MTPSAGNGRGPAKAKPAASKAKAPAAAKKPAAKKAPAAKLTVAVTGPTGEIGKPFISRARAGAARSSG